MSEREDMAKESATSATSAAVTREPAAVAPPARAGGGRAASVVLFVLIALIAAAGYLAYTRLLAPRLAALDARDATLAARQTEVRERFTRDAAQAAAYDADLAALKQGQQALEAGVKALYGRESRHSLDWVLAEAEYLVLAATQRIALEHDVATARAALIAADSRLHVAEHPDLIGVREQLTRDIAALDAVTMPDVEGLALYLAETVARVDGLPTKPIADLNMSFTAMRDETVSVDNWRGVLRALWGDLVSLVEIKDSELPDGVLFDPELRYFLQQNLKLELSSARLAMLERDTGNFRAAIKLVGALLDQYYDGDDAGVAAVRRWLDGHASLELDPVVPNIAGSLDAVRAARVRLSEAAAAGDSGQP